MKEESNLDNQTFALPGAVKENNCTAESVRSITSSTRNLSSIEFDANTVKTHQLSFNLKNPLVLLLCSICIAYIYIIIPNSNNYYFFELVKNEWRYLIAIVAHTELQDFGLPDALPITYHCAYIASFFVINMWNISQGLSNQEDNFALNTFSFLSLILTINVVYGLDAFVYNVQDRSENDPNAERLTINADDVIVENPMRESVHALSFLSIKPLENRKNIEPNPACKLFDMFVMSNKTGMTRSSEEARFSKLSHPYLAFLAAEKYIQVRVLPPGGGNATAIAVPSSSWGSIFGVLPRHYYDSPTASGAVSKKPVVLGSRKKLWLYSSLFNLVTISYYSYLIYYTEYFRSTSENTYSALVPLFLAYVVIGTVFRVVAKRLGMECDKRKMYTSSMFFMGEYICLMFYYTFYRVLFESIQDWATFFVIEFCHLFFEWICYPLRVSDTLNRLIEYLLPDSSHMGRVVKSFIFPYGLNHIDWHYFIALDFGIRCFIILSSAISFAVSLLSVSYIPWVDNALAQQGATLGFTISILIVSTVLEIINAFIINFFFFRKKKINLFNAVMDCFQDNRFAFVTTVYGAVLITNPIYAFTETSF